MRISSIRDRSVCDFTVGLIAIRCLRLDYIVRQKTLLLSATALVLLSLVVFVLSERTLNWVGYRDLEVQFEVVDAENENPIPNATIFVRTDAGGHCEDRVAREFSMTANENGKSSQICKQCMCFGGKSRFKDTFGIHLPLWWFHASAKGYSESAVTYLNAPEYKSMVDRDRPILLISIPIRLQRNRLSD